ncbi:MAG: aromatic-ring-hydroxylating dioxygenase subunit beta [Hyphomonadaceae bacterium]
MSAAHNQAENALDIREVERFFVDEAALLDEWRLEEWLELMAEDGSYLVPSLDRPDTDHREALYLIADDMVSLRSRVGQFRAKTVWAENPRSRTRRLVTNFRILSDDGGEAVVAANFAVWRFQFEQTDTYVGRYEYKLARQKEGGLKIRERRVYLDLETLRPHGKLSFIL